MVEIITNRRLNLRESQPILVTVPKETLKLGYENNVTENLLVILGLSGG